MTMFARRIALPLALLIALAGSSFAASGKAAKLDGRGGRVAVKKNLEKRGKSTAGLKVRPVGESRSGKSVQMLGATRNGKVTAFNVNKETRVARRTPTGLLSQKQAAAIAKTSLRRQNSPKKGTFSKIRYMGISNSGNYIFGSESDKSDRVYVNAKTGKATRSE